MKEVENDISGASTLVKRLTKSEKAFITKKLAASKGNKLHKQLFDLIARTTSYEEEEIKRLFLSSNKEANYTLVKSQLLELCLKYLVELDSVKNNDGQLYQRLEAARILGKRGLFSQGVKIANAVLKDAEKFDLFALQLRAYEVIYEIAAKTRNLDDVGLVVKGIESSVKKLMQHNDLLTLTHEANIVFFRMNATPEFHKRSERLKSAIPKKVETDSLKIKTALNHLKGFVALVYDCDTAKALSYYEENLALMEGNPLFSEKHPKIFDTASNTMAMCLDDMDEGERFIQVTEKIMASGMHNMEDAEPFGNIFVLRINYFQRRKMHREVVGLIEQYEKRLHAECPLMTDGLRLAIHTNAVISYFKCGEMRKALKWSNLIINENFSIYHDVMCFNRILNLAIHFELGNVEVLEATLPNIMRFLVSHGHYLGSFKTAYDFFQAYLKDYSQENEKILFRKLKENLSQISAPDNFNMNEFHEFIVAWADGKVR